MTPSSMPMLGSTVNAALETTTLRIFSLSMPMAIPALHARTRNSTHIRATARMMLPQSMYMNDEFRFCTTDMFFPFCG